MTGRQLIYLVTFGFGVSAPTLALVVRIGGFLTFPLPLPLLPLEFAAFAAFATSANGLVSPTNVALLRLGRGHPSGGVAGADRTRGPLCCASEVDALRA